MALPKQPLRGGAYPPRRWAPYCPGRPFLLPRHCSRFDLAGRVFNGFAASVNREFPYEYPRRQAGLVSMRPRKEPPVTGCRQGGPPRRARLPPDKGFWGWLNKAFAAGWVEELPSPASSRLLRARSMSISGTSAAALRWVMAGGLHLVNRILSTMFLQSRSRRRSLPDSVSSDQSCGGHFRLALSANLHSDWWPNRRFSFIRPCTCTWSHFPVRIVNRAPA